MTGLEVPQMANSERFSEAIRLIDAANGEDPRVELVDGKPRPRELLFAQRVYDCVTEMVDEPSEELLLAARAHTLRRWMIPRDRYPMTTVGYHKWRDALAQFHANEAESILQTAGYADDSIRKVKAFITKADWPENREALALEDADCLVFLDTKLRNYVDEWEDDKTVRILRRTIQKMTPAARDRAMSLKLGVRERDLLERASRPAAE
jgi:Domain of unknown function (DUF4202)